MLDTELNAKFLLLEMSLFGKNWELGEPQYYITSLLLYKFIACQCFICFFSVILSHVYLLLYVIYYMMDPIWLCA